MRLTSQVATAQPAPTKNPTQNQTMISSRLTFVGIGICPSFSSPNKTTSQSVLNTSVTKVMATK